MAAQQPRTRIQGGRLTGKLIEWKGAFGWIQPSTPVKHPLAAKRSGKVYLGQEDVEAELPGVGCMVSFLPYANAQGLGASNVRPATGAAAVQKQVQKSTPAPKAKAKAKAAATPKKPQAPGKEAKAAAPQEKGERITVSSSPIMGTVVKHMGKYCFVKAEEPIEHEAASKRPSGHVYLNFEDVDGEEKPKIGAEVMFFVYANNFGLGAEHCQIVTQGEGKLPEALKSENGRRPKEEKKQGTKKVHDKAAGKAKAKGKAKGKAGGKAEKRPSGPDLPRERVTTAPVQGEVLDWKGKYGWIKPATPIAHAEAEKNGGKIYVHSQDVLGGELEKGATVSFHCYADSRGLGAEECSAA